MTKQLRIQVLVISCFMVFFVIPVQAQIDTTRATKQKDLIDVLKKLFKADQQKMDSTRLKKKFQFSLIPVAGNVAGGGKAVATAFNASFYTDNESTTSLSTITFTPWFTLDGKFVLPFRNLIWLPNDALVLKGDTRFMIYPQYTWGLGGNTKADDKVLLQYNYLRFYHSCLKKIGKQFYLGAGYDLDFHFNNSIEDDTSALTAIPFFDYEKDANTQTISSGPVLNFSIDTRRNSANPPRGAYFSVGYRFNLESLGSTYSWESVLVDARKYFSFSKRQQNILACWSYYWAVTKGRPPYLDLPSIGWDYYNRTGRGFEQNRYRGRRMLYFESEYRRDLTRNGFWGFVIFANVHTVSEYEGNAFVYWHPAAGTGLRIKFNKISRTNIGIDVGISKGFTGLYLSLGEAF